MSYQYGTIGQGSLFVPLPSRYGAGGRGGEGTKVGLMHRYDLTAPLDQGTAQSSSHARSMECHARWGMSI
jgi:hypothetical protein